MPIYQLPAFQIDFNREALITDTCVLVSVFYSRDSKHTDARTFLFEVWEGDILIPASVIIETWGMLVGSYKNWDAGFEFLNWLTNPANPIFLLPQGIDHIGTIHKITGEGERHIDCVDAFIMYLANELTQQCNFRPPVRIATYDFGDFIHGFQKHKLRFRLINPNTLDKFPDES